MSACFLPWVVNILLQDQADAALEGLDDDIDSDTDQPKLEVAPVALSIEAGLKIARSVGTLAISLFFGGLYSFSGSLSIGLVVNRFISCYSRCYYFT